MNQLTVSIPTITIQLPDTHLIIAKEEYLALKEKSQEGRYMSLNEVLDLLSVSRPWLLDNVLYAPKIRPKIDISQNPDGFVKYPDNQGGRYFFLASKTKTFFETHFKDIFQ